MRITLNNLGLRTKIVMLATFTCLVAVLLASGGFVLYEEVSYRERLISKISLISDVVGLNCTAALAFDDKQSAEETLQALAAEKNIASGCICDQYGSRFASYGVHEGATDICPEETQLGNIVENGYLTVSRPIFLDSEQIGTIFVKHRLDESYARIRQYTLIILVVLTVSMLSAMALSSLMQKRLSKPIFHLGEIAEHVTHRKDYTVRADKFSNDEMGNLTDAFNGMLDEIQARDAALSLARDELDGRVQERTIELRSSEEQYRKLFDSVDDAIMVSHHGVFVQCNERALTMFGRTRDEFIGHAPADICAPVMADGIISVSSPQQRMVAALAGEPQFFEWTCCHSDGSHFPAEINMVSLDLNGEPHLLSVARDITERKRSEDERQDLNEKLVTASRLAGMAQIATGVLHNVGNVLNSVNVSADMIAKQLEESRSKGLVKAVDMIQSHQDDLPEFLTQNRSGRQLPLYLSKLASKIIHEQEGMLEELQSLSGNIGHIKDIVRMQQSYAQRDDLCGVLEKLSLVELVDDAIKINDAQLHRHEVRIVREYGELPPIVTDKHRVLQILINLISNAQYATTRLPDIESVLTVRVFMCDDNQAVIEVHDNGEGIAPEHVTHIFNHGFTTKENGHGFGLHSSALAAIEMGGLLTGCSDGHGCGATFKLTLLCKPDEIKSPEMELKAI